MAEMIWAYKTGLIWVSGLSFVFFLFSLVTLPWIVAWIPEDYFISLAAGPRVKSRWTLSPGKVAGVLFKNTVGIILVLGGIIMLFVPGQGLLTIMAGMILLDFPGKTRLILTLVSFRSIQRGTNWLRGKRGVPPLRFPG